MVLPIGDPPAPAVDDASLGGLGPDAFLKLLVAQMRYQNPMDPNDGAAMLQQTAQFTTVETLKEIVAGQQRLMGLQQVTLALDLVGQQVHALDLQGLPVSGTVDQVRFTVEGPMLEIGGVEIPLDNVLSIAGTDTPPPAAPPPAAPPPDPPPPDPPPAADAAAPADPPAEPEPPSPPAAPEPPAPPEAPPAAPPPVAPPAVPPPDPEPAPQPSPVDPALPPGVIGPGKGPGERA